MRNITPDEVRRIDAFLFPFESNHVIPSKSWIHETHDEIESLLIVDNRVLAYTEIVPWNENAKRLIEDYIKTYQTCNTFHIAHMREKYVSGHFLSMYNQLIAQLKYGDYIWVEVRTEMDLNLICNMQGFVRITSDTYIKRIGYKLYE